jgi:2-amino-4-hydroxy-6-hydroxymethyldihydropteridine diphosphokinase
LKNPVQFDLPNPWEWRLKDQTEHPCYTVLISLGSNIDPEDNMHAALELLQEKLDIIRKSSIWQNPAVGSRGSDYLNAVVLAETQFTLPELREDVLRRIERELGRVRQQDKYADRTIDLDALIFNGEVIDKDIWSQAHLAVPTAELLPDLCHPRSGERLSQIARRLLPKEGFVMRPDLE